MRLLVLSGVLLALVSPALACETMAEVQFVHTAVASVERVAPGCIRSQGRGSECMDGEEVARILGRGESCVGSIIAEMRAMAGTPSRFTLAQRDDVLARSLVARDIQVMLMRVTEARLAERERRLINEAERDQAPPLAPPR